jgi:uncharacterized LabA/DUF88 family protein
VDRCALFVDAGYMLADGAMAVHGTRRRESVTWDYEGVLQLLANLARDRTGLPLLRCYWYEATVEGRRTAEHDALADMPGIKLRLAKLRPGRREGVETEIHRDLTVLARNGAVSDAVVVSAEEDLAQVVSDVQDLGMRVTIVHVTVDGNWTISRSLRQECDDIMELTSAHLRPYIELIPGAEPARADEQYLGGVLAGRAASNGHSAGGTGSYQALSAGAGHAGPPSIYTAPVVAEYQRPAHQIAPHQAEEPEPDVREEPSVPPAPPLVFGRADAPPAPERAEPARPEPAARPESLRSEPLRGDGARGESLSSAGGMRADYDRPDFDPPDAGRPERGRGDRGDRARGDRGRGEPGVTALPATARGESAEGEAGPRQDMYAAPVALPFRGAPPQPPAVDDPNARGEAGNHGRHTPPDPAGPGPQPPSGRGRPAAADYPPRLRGTEEAAGYGPGGAQDQFRGEAPEAHRGVAPPPPGPFRRAPAGPPAPSGPPAGPGPQVPPGRPAAHGAPGPQPPQAPQAYVPPQNGPYSGPQPTAPPGRQPSSAPVSLTDAVQSAHEEGKEFGESVAREAPALWLEAVLARKPRMPSDLEARLLQGSALPIDFLLHDEVRHALRRGFWDALEGSRR